MFKHDEAVNLNRLWGEVERTPFYDNRDKDVMEDLLLSVQSVDAVPVVLCRDCIHYRLFYRSQPFMYYYQCGREGATRPVDEDDFCKYGERPLQ